VCGQRAGAFTRDALDKLYVKYNRPEFVHPDPLEFVYPWKVKRDREIIGLIASSLAYGRVVQILRSVSDVLTPMRPTPCIFLLQASRASLYRTFAHFKHRFTTGEELCAMLWGVKRVIELYGSLNACFTSCLNDDDDTVLPALSLFVEELASASDGRHKSLLPSPSGGSACKRLNLFLRWMVRHDRVDPGVWVDVPASKLIVPLDTHMYKISLALNLTRRKQADLCTAMEITEAFRSLVPEDPVKYDFALTRLGIRNDTDLGAFLKETGGPVTHRTGAQTHQFLRGSPQNGTSRNCA